MTEISATLRAAWEKLTVITVIDIAVVAILIYQFVANVRGRRAAQIMIGLMILLGIYIASQQLGFELLSSILALLAPYTPVALIVLFQSEIRRVLARIGRRRFAGFGGRLEERDAAEEILLALQFLSANRVGALIVVERDIGLKTFIETGISLEAQLSRDLLVSIFYPGAPMHDGAVIVQGDRIAAAACFLPLTLNPSVMNTMGTRHRAAIGITEETDCLALIVSEETGRLSYAIHGDLHIPATLEAIEEQLTGRRRRKAAKEARQENQRETVGR